MKQKHSVIENALENILAPAQKSDFPVSPLSDKSDENSTENRQLLEDAARLENSSTNMSIWLTQIEVSIEQDAVFDDDQNDNMDDLFKDSVMDTF